MNPPIAVIKKIITVNIIQAIAETIAVTIKLRSNFIPKVLDRIKKGMPT